MKGGRSQDRSVWPQPLVRAASQLAGACLGSRIPASQPTLICVGPLSGNRRASHLVKRLCDYPYATVAPTLGPR